MDRIGSEVATLVLVEVPRSEVVHQLAGTSIKVDSSGSAYVMGKTNSSQFPVTAGAFQTTFGGYGENYDGDVFVTKFNPAGTAFVYSTYLGGGDDENLASDGDLAIDSAGNAYIRPQQDLIRFYSIYEAKELKMLRRASCYCVLL